MRKLKSTLLVGAVAILALAALTASASAFTVSVRNAGAISAASLGKLTFEGGISIRCPVTLNGSLLAGPITIAAGNRIGQVNEVRIANEQCEGGSVRAALVSSAAPWNVTINSVPAGLPNEVAAVEILVNQSAFQLSVFGGFINCLYRGNAPASLAVTRTRTAGVYTTGLQSVLPNSESLIEGGFGCPSSGSFRGTFGLSPQQTLTVA